MDAAGRKRLLRSWAHERRDALPPDARREASAAACAHLQRDPVAAPSARLSVFAPIGSEIDPTPLFDRAHLAFPRVTPEGLELRWARPEALVRQPPFGIPEPTPDAAPVELSTLDLVVVPGLVFDRRGGRIGYGKGYYDRLLSEVRRAGSARFVGLAFDAQVVLELPVEPFDVLLDGLATPSGVEWFFR